MSSNNVKSLIADKVRITGQLIMRARDNSGMTEHSTIPTNLDVCMDNDKVKDNLTKLMTRYNVMLDRVRRTSRAKGKSADVADDIKAINDEMVDISRLMQSL